MLAVGSPYALGQAIPGAIRPLDVQVGGAFTFANSDYGSSPGAHGYGLYGSFDFKPHWGAELDYNSITLQGLHLPSPATPVRERTFEYGARYRRNYGRYNPFLKLAAGRGTFDSSNPLYQANYSLSYNMMVFGGGVDTNITPRFNVRVSAEYQNWFTGGLRELPFAGPSRVSSVSSNPTPHSVLSIDP